MTNKSMLLAFGVLLAVLSIGSIIKNPYLMAQAGTILIFLAIVNNNR